MGVTTLFRTQHTNILEAASTFEQQLVVSSLAADAQEARQALSVLLGHLRSHLAMEDKSLYPKLLTHPDPQVPVIAQRFIDEMGGIGEAVTNYRARWPHAASIEAEPGSFVQQSLGILVALRKRIDEENHLLYPLLES